MTREALLRAGYQPEQILGCPRRPCLCTFPQGGLPRDCGLARPVPTVLGSSPNRLPTDPRST